MNRGVRKKSVEKPGKRGQARGRRKAERGCRCLGKQGVARERIPVLMGLAERVGHALGGTDCSGRAPQDAGPVAGGILGDGATVGTGGVQ